jgi:hypothetical protein
MITNTQIRNQIFRKIKRIPADRLKELEMFLSKLEETTNKKDRNLSFAGAWENIDEHLFNEFTDNLIDRRQRNKS